MDRHRDRPERPGTLSPDLTVARRVEEHCARMSSLLECGRGMTGAYADTHRIRLTVRTWLEAAGSSTDVKTRVVAEASSVEGTAGTIACSSRGQLEARIAAALREAAAR